MSPRRGLGCVRPALSSPRTYGARLALPFGRVVSRQINNACIRFIRSSSGAAPLPALGRDICCCPHAQAREPDLGGPVAHTEGPSQICPCRKIHV